MTVDRPANMATEHEMAENVDSAVLKNERVNSLDVVSSCSVSLSDEAVR